MAGLVTPYELLRAGHDPLILESRHRVGGRVHTLRAPFTHGLYGEAGAMRIPRSHDLSLAYVANLGLTVYPVTQNDPRALCDVNGTRCRTADARARPDLFAFDVADHERGKTAGQLCRESIQPLVARVLESDEHERASIVSEYDSYSLREFLQAQNWSQGAM